jgi:hypothetical protein
MAKDDDAGHVIRDTARQVMNAVLHREDAEYRADAALRDLQ